MHIRSSGFKTGIEDDGNKATIDGFTTAFNVTGVLLKASSSRVADFGTHDNKVGISLENGGGGSPAEEA